MRNHGGLSGIVMVHGGSWVGDHGGDIRFHCSWWLSHHLAYPLGRQRPVIHVFSMCSMDQDKTVPSLVHITCFHIWSAALPCRGILLFPPQTDILSRRSVSTVVSWKLKWSISSFFCVQRIFTSTGSFSHWESPTILPGLFSVYLDDHHQLAHRYAIFLCSLDVEM